MLVSVSRSSTDISSIPDPPNCIALYAAPSVPISPIIFNMRSLAITCSGSFPFILKYKVSGTLNQIFPFNNTYAISVCPKPHANAPRVPVVLVCESPPT